MDNIKWQVNGWIHAIVVLGGTLLVGVLPVVGILAIVRAAIA